jgi:hypothetical protein
MDTFWTLEPSVEKVEKVEPLQAVDNQLVAYIGK